MAYVSISRTAALLDVLCLSQLQFQKARGPTAGSCCMDPPRGQIPLVYGGKAGEQENLKKANCLGQVQELNGHRIESQYFQNFLSP